MHFTKLKHPENAIFIRNERIDLARLIRNVVRRLGIQMKLVLQY